MIGLLDHDALAAQTVKRPNLELMKMAAYLRRSRQSCRIVLDLDDLDIYTQVIVFQNNKELGYPTTAFRKRDTEWYGLAFTDGKYKPMSREIEESAPDISIYKQLFRKFLLEDKMTEREIGYLLNASYLRLSMPLNRRYLRLIRKNRRAIVYDDFAFTGPWEENVKALLKRGIVGFYFLNRQVVSDLELWKKIYLDYDRRIFNYNPIALDIPFDLANMDTILKVYEKMQGENKSFIGVQDNLLIYVNIVPPYRENTLKFAEAVGKQMAMKQPVNWRMAPSENPYHSFVAALAAWSRATAFSKYTFMEYLIKKDLHRQRRFALKLIKENKKYSLIFNYKPEVVMEFVGGLKYYETRGNYCSIFSDYLTV